jgi:hypothetical protein
MKNKLIKLLNESKESYYWLGFIMADGYITKNNRLRIGLSIKDATHLETFRRFINCGTIRTEIKTNSFGTFESASISIMDVKTLGDIKNRFKIETDKSKNPINIESLSNENLIPFLVGYIDGDGSIIKQSNRNDCRINFHIHSSWIVVLENIRTRLEGIYNIKIPKPKIDKEGYCTWNIANNEIITSLKNKSIECELPILKRKWDRIDENKISRYKKTKENREIIQKLLLEGKKNNDICKILNLKPSMVSQTIKKIKLINNEN